MEEIKNEIYDIYGNYLDPGYTGYGKCYKDDKLIYEGYFVNDEANGYGILYDNDVTIYEGDFVNNEPNGYGILYYNDGAIYEGYFVNDEPNGYGILYDKDIEVLYKGDFVNGNFDGHGKYFFKQGYFDGEFSNGKYLNGKFYLVCNVDGNHYDFSDGKFIYTLETKEDGSRIIKYYLNDQKDTELGDSNLILTINKDHEMTWNTLGKNVNDIIDKTKTLLNHFTEEESIGYNSILANLAMINTDQNIVQFANQANYVTYDIPLEKQLTEFLKFAEEQDEGKIVTSTLSDFIVDHDVGIIHKNGETVAIDTSDALGDASKKIFKKYGISILTMYNAQDANNCPLTAKSITEKLAEFMSKNNNITIDDFALYSDDFALYSGDSVYHNLSNCIPKFKEDVNKLKAINDRLLSVIKDMNNKYLYINKDFTGKLEWYSQHLTRLIPPPFSPTIPSPFKGNSGEETKTLSFKEFLEKENEKTKGLSLEQIGARLNKINEEFILKKEGLKMDADIHYIKKNQFV